MKSQDEKQKFLELKAKGWSYDRIAKELKISKQSLINWGSLFRSELENLRAIELQSIIEEAGLLKEHRIKTFGEILGKVKTELEGRDLSEIPTAQLLEIYRKYYSMLKDEVEDKILIWDEETINNRTVSDNMFTF